mmetsp:Transcript_60585/g.91411  ORF Transcript_60585/g.91411 Transcript_60585/m.91411 type:complete len:217 (+) Transcript_60585:364-1014(+)
MCSLGQTRSIFLQPTLSGYTSLLIRKRCGDGLRMLGGTRLSGVAWGRAMARRSRLSAADTRIRTTGTTTRGAKATSTLTPLHVRCGERRCGILVSLVTQQPARRRCRGPAPSMAATARSTTGKECTSRIRKLQECTGITSVPISLIPLRRTTAFLGRRFQMEMLWLRRDTSRRKSTPVRVHDSSRSTRRLPPIQGLFAAEPRTFNGIRSRTAQQRL